MDGRLPSPFGQSTVIEHFYGNGYDYPAGQLSALGPSWTSTGAPGNNSGFWYNGPKNTRVPPTSYSPKQVQFSKYKQTCAFYCESCDRAFDNNSKLQEHLNEHVTCGRDGCKFKGHPKIVQNHQRMQHDTGLAAKIMQLNSTEEIKQWREERKKNYPTNENVARKEKEKTEKLARGEVLNVKQFGKMKGMDGRRMGRQNSKFRDRKPYKTPEIMKPSQAECVQKIPAVTSEKPAPLDNGKNIDENNKDPSSEEEGEYHSDEEVKVNEKCVTAHDITEDIVRNITTDDPMSSILNNGNSIIEKTSVNMKTETPAATVVSGGLGTIMNSYMSESEEEGECEESRPIPNVSNKTFKPRALRFRPKKHGSLLMKLLAKEVHRERNMIFQCIRYIVNENYFGVEQK